MTHFKPFEPRHVVPLQIAVQDGWRLKRYAILARTRTLEDQAVTAATEAAFRRLPRAGTLQDAHGNHGVGFQILHFAKDIPLVSPVFYWKWGSVLSNALQMRSYSTSPYEIVDGVTDVVGCVWEMDIVAFEVAAWRDIVLTSAPDEPAARIARYLSATKNR